MVLSVTSETRCGNRDDFIFGRLIDLDFNGKIEHTYCLSKIMFN